jgi:HK97 family phage major capsid protein
MSIETISKSLDKIESNFHSVKNTQQELAERVLYLEQKGHTPPVQGPGHSDTLGSVVARKFRDGMEAFKRHKVLSLEIETKSVTASLVGARASISPTPGRDMVTETQLAPKLTMQAAGGVASLIYPRRAVAISGPGAGAVSENGARPQSEPIYTSITQNLCTVAGYAELSETALRTTGELQSVIDLHLSSDVLRATDVLLVGGGTGFAGGFLALATPDVLPVDVPGSLLEETIAIGAMSMRADGYRPNIVVVNPLDWRPVYLRKDTTGAYVHSSPLAQAPLNISGCAVVFSAAVTSGQALLIDSRYVDFMPSDNIRIELAHVASQFLTGEITVRAELQGIPVVRDLAAIKLMSRA